MSDIVSLRQFRKTNGPGPTSSTSLVKKQVSRSMYFPEAYRLLVNYFNVPYRLVFIWTSLTRLRQDIGAIIVRGGSNESALDQVAGYLNWPTGIRPVLRRIREGSYIFGEGASVAFELAAFRTIYGANASRNCDWDAAIVHYSQTGELLATCWYELSSSGILGDADSLKSLFAGHSVANGKRVVMWPMKRLIVFSTKIARCLHGLGQQKAAVYGLERESASAGTWFDEWKLVFMPSVPQEQLDVTSWDCYNSYRCGYAHITLGMIEIGQKELEAAEKSIGSAVLFFAQCREIDYMLHYATTANALLGWVRGDLRKHDDAIHNLETAHTNYSSSPWDSTSFYRDGYSEVKKRLCRLEYMLSLSYDHLENKQKRVYWRERAEFSRQSLAPQGSESMTEKESYESLTDFGVSDLFSIEEVMMDWMII